MEVAMRPIRAPRDALEGAGEYIDRAVGPAAAVHSLEPPLLAASSVTDDLPGYLAVMSRFKEALHFLSDNCGITSQWLVDIVEYLEDRSLAAALAFSRLAAATAAASSPAACSSPASPRWPRGRSSHRRGASRRPRRAGTAAPPSSPDAFPPRQQLESRSQRWWWRRRIARTRRPSSAAPLSLERFGEGLET
uniref:Uncharacterized protein n=1 Tax=Oryza sativa subsp. japonica TaxID=39947 RepID=Q2R0C8_ORYSJ|nr:hypothetical protein LOC_Os11g43000 [Oryza sativa Japonica Group]